MTKCIYIVGFGSIGKRHLHIIKTLLPNSMVFIVRHQYTEEQYTDFEKELIEGTMYIVPSINSFSKSVYCSSVY